MKEFQFNNDAYERHGTFGIAQPCPEKDESMSPIKNPVNTFSFKGGSKKKEIMQDYNSLDKKKVAF